jgi:hypothetical protein
LAPDISNGVAVLLGVLVHSQQIGLKHAADSIATVLFLHSFDHFNRILLICGSHAWTQVVGVFVQHFVGALLSPSNVASISRRSRASRA